MNQNFNPPLNMSTSLLCSQSNPAEQVRLIVTHPFFTGRCPQCKHKLALVERTPGQCHCKRCNWSDSEAE